MAALLLAFAPLTLEESEEQARKAFELAKAASSVSSADLRWRLAATARFAVYLRERNLEHVPDHGLREDETFDCAAANAYLAEHGVPGFGVEQHGNRVVFLAPQWRCRICRGALVVELGSHAYGADGKMTFQANGLVKSCPGCTLGRPEQNAKSAVTS